MSKKYLLASSVLFTLAALFWSFNLLTADKSEGWPLMGILVSMTFVALAAIYWCMFFRRRKSTQPSGTE